MNAARRKQIEAVKATIKTLEEQRDALNTAIDAAREEVERIRDDEQEYRDNMPESLANGEKGDKADSAITSLEEAIQRLEDIGAEVVDLDFSDVNDSLDTAKE
jgi:uncharacterized coiled-coil DUF342 family protein